MAEITAGMVKTLREKTDAPMMECKKALTEAYGDLDRAEEILRVKLGNKASKASARLAAEGLIGTYISANANLAALIEVNCETDFVAKNTDFISFCQQLAEKVALENPADVATLSALSLGEGTVETARASLVGKIGENLSIRRFKRIQTDNQIVHYVHSGKIGVLLEYAGNATIAKDIAMHIAAMKPAALKKEDISAELIEKERTIAAEKAAESGKPADIITKMVDGSVQKYLKEVTLLSQPFVKDDKQTIEQILNTNKTTIQQFVLYVVGEGIEKKTSDFAAEVAAQAAAARA